MKLDRLLSIVILLLGRERVGAAELAGRFEVTVRTIYRDIEAINLAGVPIVSLPGPGGGFGIERGYTIDRRLLGGDEFTTIISALKGLSSAFGDASAESALDKVRSMVPREGGVRYFEDRLVLDLIPWGYREEERRLLKTIQRAVAEERVLRFSYASYGKAGEERVVEPMTLVFKAYAWYLWGYCRLRGDFRLFKLSRIRGLASRPERFPRRAGSYRDETEPVPSAFVELSLRFDPSAAAKVEEWFGQESIERDDAGRLCLRTRLPEGGWIGAFLLGFGPGLEVLSPEAVRCGLRAAAERLVRDNGPSPSP
jgi:predicted DNA-binding transcriptional regulator YafY